MGLEILITNDDGYTAKGINVIAKLLSKYGNITMLAPNDGQSGMATALSINKTLRLHYISTQEGYNGNTITTYALTGTPVDCVKMAMYKLFPDKKPDLLVSGINHGTNTSAAAIYSGTLGACAEGTLYGIPSIGLSIDDHSANANFTVVENYIDFIINNYLKNPTAPGVYLNINFPGIPANKVKGIKFTSQGKGMWIKEYDERTDPHNATYYWMTGEFLNQETQLTGDYMLMKDGYITIVPHKVDTTDYEQISALESAWKIR